MKFKILLIPFLCFICISCSSKVEKIGDIKIKGSNTMLLLVQHLAQEYRKEHQGVFIDVEGGGTGLGIRALIENQADIADASRNLEPEEVRVIASKFGSVGVSTLIARDGIGLYVNKNNPLNDLSMNTLRKIYLGEIKNWNEINGLDQVILPVARNDYSGTAAHFKTRVLNERDFAPSVIIEPDVKQIFSEVEKNVNAIGFSGLGYKSDCKLISIDGVYPTEENIKNMKYPLSRYLHFITINAHTGIVKDFINWVLGPKGQKIIKEFGFVSLYDFSY